MPTKSIVSSGIIGLAAPTVSKALVPVAMSTFGVVQKVLVLFTLQVGLQQSYSISSCGLMTSGSAAAVPTAIISFIPQ